METLKEKLLSEIETFREKGEKFYNGEVTMMDFKHASGGMGVYAEKGGKSFMIRLRIPSGIMSVTQLKEIYQWSEKYDAKRLHLTTRQAIQYHKLTIDSICDLMIDALNKDIYTRGAGGNFPRNVALSPLSGVDPEEAFDPTDYALETGNYFMERILTYKLPRKLKVSFSNSEKDTAHCTVQDLGFLAVNENGENYFRVYIGGGLGRNPKLALVYPELIKPNEVLYYTEAMVELFKAEGNYENKAKARIRYIVDKLGEEGFINAYKCFVDKAKENKELELNIEAKEVKKTGIKINIENPRLYKQKQEGLYSVYIHPIGGQLENNHTKDIIDILECYEDTEIRLSMTEGAYIRNLNGDEAIKVLEITENIGGKTKFEYSVACIGVPTCQMGIAHSQETLNEIISYVKNINSNIELLPRIYISGCGNSCGVHEIGSIGFTGKKKRINDVVEEAYELHINGSFLANEPRLAEVHGDIAKKEIPKFIAELNEILQKAKKDFNSFLKENNEELLLLIKKYNC